MEVRVVTHRLQVSLPAGPAHGAGGRGPHRAAGLTLGGLLPPSGDAADPPSLLAALRDHPDVIVLDVMMPKVDGWQVASTLRNHPGLTDAPIVFCTGLGHDESMWQDREFGAASIVTKPFDPGHLVAEVSRAALV